MFKNNKKNFHVKNRYSEKEQYKSLLISNESKVLILGAGKAAGIKYKSFSKKNFKIDIYSDEILDCYILEYLLKNPLNRIYEFKDINFSKYGLIIIATSDTSFNEDILRISRELNKLYLYCPDYSLSNTIIPVEVDTESFNISISTKVGSPYTSKFISEKLRNFLEDYDDFALYVSNIRKAIICKKYKNELLKFINTDDFYFFYKKGKQDLILKLFYDFEEGEDSEDNSRN